MKMRSSFAIFEHSNQQGGKLTSLQLSPQLS
jgi:hypothetical protein